MRRSSKTITLGDFFTAAELDQLALTEVGQNGYILAVGWEESRPLVHAYLGVIRDRKIVPLKVLKTKTLPKKLHQRLKP